MSNQKIKKASGAVSFDMWRRDGAIFYTANLALGGWGHHKTINEYLRPTSTNLKRFYLDDNRESLQVKMLVVNVSKNIEVTLLIRLGGLSPST